MKVLSTERLGLHGISYWIEDKDQYISQVIDDGNHIEDWAAVPTSNFKNYDHFCGVMGKFNPYTVFMLKPIVIDKLDFETMLGVCNEFEKIRRGDTSKGGTTNAK